MTTARRKLRETKPKTKTFTGCWTCRARKVKCDSTRPECGRCKKAGLACGGYDLKLYWVTDEDTVAPSAIKRQAMTLQGCSSWTFRLDEVDRQIADLDACVSTPSSEVSITVGPFSVFRAGVPALEESQAAELGEECTLEPDIPASGEDTSSDGESLSGYCSMEGEALTEMPSVCGDEWQLQVSSPRREASSLGYGLTSSLFGDPLIHRLMDNYVCTVANLLPPLPHPQNPYASIYVPKAMYGASNHLLGVGYSASEVPSSNVAIFYALLATSAFHLRGSDLDGASELDLTARRFRAKAFAYLQKALQEPLTAGEDQGLGLSSTSSNSSTAGEAIISAMLTLITTDVVEGSMSEYWIHLDGVNRYARQLRSEVGESSGIDRLIAISSFLSTLANSTSVDLPPIPWSDDNLTMSDLSYSDSVVTDGLEFAYGITPTLANLMRRVVVLAQHISYYISNSLDLPPRLISACMSFSETLSQWSIESEPLSSMLTGTDADMNIALLLAKNHTLAFAHGLRVYYHTRILPCSPAEMQRYVDCVANHLTIIEEIKTAVGFDYNTAATITWPGFIASCEAGRGRPREVWYRWWEGMIKYRIGNIAHLWKIVQEAWRLKDEDGSTEVPAWMPVLRRSGKRILAV
ncbi:hypothetical protein HRR83_003698 [Exophiala dermatitidis]|nr:hypothetical protein HRR75_002673 [Exophiala dermatitidis]KAJ4543175.1 hypothetical protein HRR77_005431 [Exophiala dermatitidis]KAJ4543674.1 hypothetical protein HRR76_001739 [Exophiala dermatitidis]KAJ4557355.1 hypothetical protein HRR78_001023 [Exophiala dermatitidis]KAJ4575138.1 hypothetical protein HRR79_002069 [Exophiala dermatitidis]